MMIAEFFQHLSQWSPLDTWIVVTAALVAMACALPGNYLVLRRQSLMGDAISHTVLLGIVLAFLFTHWLRSSGWISAATYAAVRNSAMFLGAVLIGVVSSVLMELVRKLGRVESTAALGVVFTTLFAAGLLLIRVAADHVHIDPDCVLYGTLETAVVGEPGVPAAAWMNGSVLLVNLLLVVLFFKELRISAFDPNLATAQGINAQAMHYGLMVVTAITLVSAFESVGSILVIAMLIVPPSTAYLLTDRLERMVVLSLIVAAASAALGHVLAITMPPIIFSRLGFPTVVDASTAGMMAVAAGLLFTLAVVFSPKHGLLSKLVHKTALGIKIAAEDVLGLLYRLDETKPASSQALTTRQISAAIGFNRLVTRLAILRLSMAGKLSIAAGLRLTQLGRREAQGLVRSHRLWESYMARHFAVPSDHLHETASRVEHYLDPALRRAIAKELDTPGTDPHGREIPAEEPPGT